METNKINVSPLSVEGRTYTRWCFLAVDLDLVPDVIPFLFGRSIWVGSPFLPQGLNLRTCW